MSTTSPTYLHFTLGSVQEFVAQARRSSDLWVGSYLVSYLMGRALVELDGLDGVSIVLPEVKNNEFLKLLKTAKQTNSTQNIDTKLWVGSLPNRFKLRVEKGVAADLAETAQRGIHAAWQEIAAAVCTHFKEDVLKNCVDSAGREEIDKIWRRQTYPTTLWPVIWAVGESDALLAQRKNLRTNYGGPNSGEPGFKCTVCGQRQALVHKKESSYQDTTAFWKELAGKINSASRYLIKEEGKERLCAVCLIRRLLPRLGDKALKYNLCTNYPSTVYLSAVDWLKDICKRAEQEPALKGAIQALVEVAKQTGVIPDESAKHIHTLYSIHGRGGLYKELLSYTGDLFFPDTIEHNEWLFKNRNKNDKQDTKDRGELKNALRALNKVSGPKPSPFYALLMMDGDKMGGLLAKYPNDQDAIARAIAAFSGTVYKIVEEESDGKLIYAGGEDVFALLPLNTALDCAAKLNLRYREAFRGHAKMVEPKEATISAGINYVHMNTTLQAVVRDTHKLLDDIAKQKLGRDAFAVRVWKRGGPVLTFGKKWSEQVGGKTIDWAQECNAIKVIYKTAADKNRVFPSGFFYKIQKLEPILAALNKSEQIQLLTAEYLKSREELDLPDKKQAQARLTEAETRVRRLYEFSLVEEEVEEDGGKLTIKRLNPDGPLFIRFLAQKEL